MPFQKEWPLILGRNQFIFVYIFNDQWGWTLDVMASQKEFHCTLICMLT